MNAFKQSFFKKDGKLNISLILLKLAFIAMGIVYIPIFVKAKDISFGGYAFPPHPFTLFHWIMLIPAVAAFAFAVLAVNERWLRIVWQLAIVMAALLVISAVVGVFTGMHSETTDKNNYLVLDGYFKDTDAPMLDPDSDIEPEITFEETVKKLMPESIPENAGGVHYYYYFKNLPVLGGNFDVFARWQLDEGSFSAEKDRLKKQYPLAKVFSEESKKNDPETEYYIVRGDDDNGEYYYIFYGVNDSRKEMTYCVAYSDKDSAKPYFERIGIDLGRIGKIEDEESAIAELPEEQPDTD